MSFSWIFFLIAALITGGLVVIFLGDAIIGKLPHDTIAGWSFRILGVSALVLIGSLLAALAVLKSKDYRR
jgi:hypothetical protein